MLQVLLDLGVPFNRPVAKTGLFQTAHNDIPWMGGGGNQFCKFVHFGVQVYSFLSDTVYIIGPQAM